MTHRSRWALAAAVLGALLVGFVATSLTAAPRPAEDRSSSYVAATGAAPTAARTALPGLVPASGDPTLPGFAVARPAVDTVTQVAGPFDDRYTWSRLRLGPARVSGELTVTSDVSDLLELQVLVGFYDAQGHLLDIARVVRHHSLHEDTASGLPDESVRVAVNVPERLRTTVAAAAVGVPVLVNE